MDRKWLLWYNLYSSKKEIIIPNNFEVKIVCIDNFVIMKSILGGEIIDKYVSD